MRGTAMVVIMGSLLLAACGGGGAQGAAPPAGGWPQPRGGKVDGRMCGLLREDDYAAYGHPLGAIAARSTFAPNGLTCSTRASDAFTVEIEPTAETARLIVARQVRLARLRGARSVARAAVPGADESWTSTEGLGKRRVFARRGALIVGIDLSPRSPAKDPWAALTGLAGLVLRRLPDAGRTDTGTTRTVTYTAGGTGRAPRLRYYDTADERPVTLRNVRLPWTERLPFVPPLGFQPPASFDLLAVGAAGCAIVADGREVARSVPGGPASCRARIGR
ncbi:hypothetical protein [Actinomadura parmotrematis]|uniref:Lipoprotein n=1 Tax=Actinomadura parmotrematis TaxID=2864039 RepID=A0ABS7FSX8_9ACTN|nr:hypothetical protein [Actinomadura parmotrematis]MBW8483310.1 hypothetical protein [Actinomadura parmotrematis]